ncbi:asparagine--tRNA ligase [Desulfobacca acetoxidans]|uniref:Asparagine--tRNA ligase n=1 Tax=Desulfobacca acetoxidans (strain ATCC 700848 / DSM 11109 / ASRB2) TaxID=880072 RepID=F2NC44_DESAR|nr:asparagine--tRNA ligase [Desulfobacca acetoxidans]AEB08839.1 Asparaginyl-tRNA synthetase [Desulfobacca acetoxidans DSM 11109]
MSDTINGSVYIADLPDKVGQEVSLRGWLYNKRSSGKVRFLILRDGTGLVQGVMVKGKLPETDFTAFDRLTQESSLSLEGVVRVEPRAPGGYELEVTAVHPLHVASEYPISHKEHGVDFLLNHRHLWLRSPRQQAVLRVRDEIIRACRDFFADRRFVLVDTPIFTPTACEGTTTLFETDYFGDRKAYLTQSGQLYLEAAALALGRVYCFGPTFRAEKSKTRRHLTEFWMLETEVAFADLEDIMALAEALLCAVAVRVLENRIAELTFLERPLAPLQAIRPPFPRLSYTESLKRLTAAGHQLAWGEDLGAPEETALSQMYDRPVLIHHYPKECKAFYMKPDTVDPRTVLCVDVLAPEGVGEIIGGSQREDDLEALLTRIKEHHLPQEPLEWYLDLRRYGSVPHSGFGLGIERLVTWFCGLHHVREAIPFPRLMDRLTP